MTAQDGAERTAQRALATAGGRGDPQALEVLKKLFESGFVDGVKRRGIPHTLWNPADEYARILERTPRRL